MAQQNLGFGQECPPQKKKKLIDSGINLLTLITTRSTSTLGPQGSPIGSHQLPGCATVQTLANSTVAQDGTSMEKPGEGSAMAEPQGQGCSATSGCSTAPSDYSKAPVWTEGLIVLGFMVLYKVFTRCL